MITLLPYESEILNCKDCDFHKTCEFPLDYVSTWKNIQVMVITEKPSKEEDKLTWAFGDRHNQYLQDRVNNVFNGQTVHYTYLIKCATEKSLSIKNTKTCYEKFLFNEINELRPPIIVTMGAFVSKLLCKFYEFGMYTFNGVEGIDRDEYSPYIFAWESPVKLLNSGVKKTEKFVEILRELKSIL